MEPDIALHTKNMDTVSEPRTRWKEVASTKNVYSAPINQISSREANAKLGLIVDDFEPLISRPNPRDEEETNYFKELQW